MKVALSSAGGFVLMWAWLSLIPDTICHDQSRGLVSVHSVRSLIEHVVALVYVRTLKPEVFVL